nr:hypothetical protein [Cupriavidus neocaledonicus]
MRGLVLLEQRAHGIDTNLPACGQLAAAAQQRQRPRLVAQVPPIDRHGFERAQACGFGRLALLGQRILEAQQRFAQLHLPADLRIDPGQLRGKQGSRGQCSRIQDLSDFFERDIELPERQDLLQAMEILLAVKPVSRFRANRWPEQAELVVVVQGAYGEPRTLCQFANF